MIIRKILAAAALGSLLALPASAQDGITSGYLMSRQGLGITDMAEMSSINQGFGTARSAAMGGAFTSLGADLSSMGINPAGLGLYRSSEIGVSTAFNIGQYDNDSFGTSLSKRKTRMSLDNLGIAFNLFEDSGELTSVTLGVAYNKLADLNYRSTAMVNSDHTSIGNVFANHARGISHGYMNSTDSRDFDQADFGDWLAYHTGLLEPTSIDGQYDAPNVGAGQISHYATTKSKGHIGETNISIGINLRNKVYAGLSVGIQDIYQKQTVSYYENYATSTPNYLNSMQYHQMSKINGDAVNFKFGVIANPVEGLRIGLAVHTPSYVNIEKSYRAEMGSRFNDNNTYSMRSDYVYSEYDFRTPTRLLTGASYVFGDKGLISFDYERMWYNGIRIDIEDDVDNYEDVFKEEVKDTYKARNTFRLGAEFKPVPFIALRGGFAHYGSFLKDEKQVLDSPVAYKGYNISGGLGFRFNEHLSLDLAYVYMKSYYTDYNLYFYDGLDNNDIPLAKPIKTDKIEQNSLRHNMIMTLSCRF